VVPVADIVPEVLEAVDMPVEASRAEGVPGGLLRRRAPEDGRRQIDARFHQVAVAGERQHAGRGDCRRRRVMREAVPGEHVLLELGEGPHGVPLSEGT
jgi:hypothetical protein